MQPEKKPMKVPVAFGARSLSASRSATKSRSRATARGGAMTDEVATGCGAGSERLYRRRCLVALVATVLLFCLTVSKAQAADTTPPTITITSPVASGGTYSTGSATVTVSGTASDNVGVVDVIWDNNRGGGGLASGTTSWSASGIALQTGSNVITAHAFDAAGNTKTASITVNYTVDTTPPSIAITSPVASGQTYSTGSATVTVSGTASDNVGVVDVIWDNNRGGGGLASGTTSWSASGIALQTGSNNHGACLRCGGQHQDGFHHREL